jgi:septal ring factor EnvC (AmiA/AmiB activator)
MLIAFLFLALLAWPAAPAVRAESKEAKRQELERLQKEMESQKERLQHAGRKERSILTTLEKIDREIQEGSGELAGQQRRLRDAEASLTEIERANAATGQELDRLKAAYAARLRALYKLSRQGGYAPAILSAESFPDAYKRMRYLEIIAEHDRAVIGQYRQSLELLILRQKEIQERRSDILARTSAVETKRGVLEERRRKKAELLASVKHEKGTYEATLKDLEEATANLWAMIRLGEREKKPSPPADQGAKASGGHERLPWPVEGKVLNRFGMQRHPEFGTMIYRRGIDITVRTGEDVHAVRGGQVAYADWYKGYGRLVIIDHGGGLYTLYGHLSQLAVTGGDQVKQGQVIGQAGDTGSLKGPRLYFEIRRNGEAEDPLLWLAKR